MSDAPRSRRTRGAAKPRVTAKASPANPARGEHELTLAGTTYVLRPTFAANSAIEEQLDASLLLLTRKANAGDLTYAEIGVIAAEYIRAGATDPLTGAVGAGRLAELAYEEGQIKVIGVLTLCLIDAVTGGRTASGEAKATPERPAWAAGVA